MKTEIEMENLLRAVCDRSQIKEYENWKSFSPESFFRILQNKSVKIIGMEILPTFYGECLQIAIKINGKKIYFKGTGITKSRLCVYKDFSTTDPFPYSSREISFTDCVATICEYLSQIKKIQEKTIRYQKINKTLNSVLSDYDKMKTVFDF